MDVSEQSLGDDVSYQTIIVMVVSMVLVNSAVLLRLIAIRMMKLQLMADDNRIILAAVCRAFTLPRPTDGLTSHSSLLTVMLSSTVSVSSDRIGLDVPELT